jgi:menaquinone-specific isochorismate synthase
LSTSKKSFPKVQVTVDAGHDGEMNKAIQILKVISEFMKTRSNVSFYTVMKASSQSEKGLSKKRHAELVTRALNDINKKKMEYMSYARCVDFKFSAPVSAIQLLYRIVFDTKESEDNKRYIVYFCPKGKGETFISVSHQQLCKIENGRVELEAHAGTFPKGAPDMTPIVSAQLDATTRHISGCMQSFTGDIIVGEPSVIDLYDSAHIYRKLIVKGYDTDDCEILDFCCRQIHPSVGGRSQDLINENEPEKRKFFSAPIGYHNHQTESSEMCVGVRSAVVNASNVKVFAESWIGPGSTHEKCWAEMEMKIDW